MLQSCGWVVSRVGAVPEDSAGIPSSTRINRHITRFLAEADTVDDAVRPRLTIPEAGLIVVCKYAKNGRAKPDCAQNLRARCGEFLRVFLTHPVFVRKMHEQRHAGIDRRYHRLGTDRVDLDH